MPKEKFETYGLYFTSDRLVDGSLNIARAMTAVPTESGLVEARYMDVLARRDLVEMFAGEVPMTSSVDRTVRKMLDIAFTTHEIYDHGIVIGHDIWEGYVGSMKDNATLYRARKNIDDMVNTPKFVNKHGAIPVRALELKVPTVPIDALWLGCPNGRGMEALEYAKLIAGSERMKVRNFPGNIGFLSGEIDRRPRGFNSFVIPDLSRSAELYPKGIVLEQHNSCIEFDVSNDQQIAAIREGMQQIDRRVKGAVPVYGIFVARDSKGSPDSTVFFVGAKNGIVDQMRVPHMSRIRGNLNQIL